MLILRLGKGAINLFTKAWKKKSTYAIGMVQKKIIKHQTYGQKNSFTFLNYPIVYIGPGEFLHAWEEIFEDEIYKTNFFNDAPTIIDCGANIGISVLYFKMQYPKAKVLAYEPDTINFELLQKNTQHLTNVELFKEAIWIHNETLEFEDVAAQGSKISTSDEPNKNVKTITVKAKRLRDIIQQTPIIDLLKIDIEGAEYEVIKDCVDVLKGIQNIFLEYHGTFKHQHHLTELLDIVDNAGFNFYINSATNTFQNPFLGNKKDAYYDLQLNIFCIRKPLTK